MAGKFELHIHAGVLSGYSNEPPKKLVIPYGVNKIERSAFYHSDTIEEVEFPETLFEIEMGAFEECGLKKVHIHKKLHTIGEGAFANNEIEELTFEAGDGEKLHIGQNAFSLNNIEKLVLPPRTSIIGDSSFYDNKIRTLDFGTRTDNLSIGVSAFEQNLLTEVEIPKKVHLIERGTFAYNKLTKVTIPNDIESINTLAFKDNFLTKLKLPSKLKVLEDMAFGNNKFDDIIVLPKTMIIISYSAFFQCDDILYIENQSNVKLYNKNILIINNPDKRKINKKLIKKLVSRINKIQKIYDVYKKDVPIDFKSLVFLD